MNNVDMIEFCKYIQTVVSGCAGFIRTQGYMYHQPGIIVMMNADETVVSIIKIPIIFDIKFAANINTLRNVKEEKDMEDLFNQVYFTGLNIKENILKKYLYDYINLDEKCRCIFQEEDCHNLVGFDDKLGSSDIHHINIVDDGMYYRIPISKSFTPVSKPDSCGIKIYDYIYDQSNLGIKTVKYIVYKKKFKLNIEIYFNILIT